MKLIALLGIAALTGGCARIEEMRKANRSNWRIVHHYGPTIHWDEYFVDDVVLGYGYVYFRQQDGRETYLYGNITVTREARP